MGARLEMAEAAFAFVLLDGCHRTQPRPRALRSNVAMETRRKAAVAHGQREQAPLIATRRGSLYRGQVAPRSRHFGAQPPGKLDQPRGSGAVDKRTGSARAFYPRFAWKTGTGAQNPHTARDFGFVGQYSRIFPDLEQTQQSHLDFRSARAFGPHAMYSVQPRW